MIQYSVYMRIISSHSKAESDIHDLKKYLPKNGNIRILAITNKQYINMLFLRGNKNINESINEESRLIKIENEN